MKIEILDLDFMNTGQVVASFLLMDDDGTSAALVETGPTTCLDRLTAGLKEHGVSHEDVQQVFLTHTHPDHAAPQDISRSYFLTRLSTCTRSATRILPTPRSS